MKNKNQQNEKGNNKKVRFLGDPEKNIFCSIAAYPAFFLVLIIFSLTVQGSLSVSTIQDQQQPEKLKPHFYNVDREITIEGQVEDLKFESRYEGKGHFLILIVKDKTSGELLEVETAPAWFFKIDIHKGEKVRLIGSLTEDQEPGKKKLVMARELKVNNQTITLRDRRGFPAWSSGQGRKRGSVD
jgi:hypothetical protein